MKKYTDGPRRYTEDDYCDGDVGIIAGFGSIEQKEGIGYTICQMCDFDEDEIKANAHLIAAAPELLEALEGLAMYFHSGNTVPVERATLLRDHGEVKAMFAAIKKAKGETE